VIVPDILYRLARAPASTGPLIELFSVRATASSAATTVSANLAGVPIDKILILTNLSIDLAPGAAQSVIRTVLSGQTPGGLIWTIAQLGFVAVADFRQGFNWQGEIAIGGGTGAALLSDSVFSAGVAANAVTLNAFGYVIPKANVAPF